MYQCSRCRQTFSQQTDSRPYCRVKFGFTQTRDNLFPSWEKERAQKKAKEVFRALFFRCKAVTWLTKQGLLSCLVSVTVAEPRR